MGMLKATLFRQEHNFATNTIDGFLLRVYDIAVARRRVFGWAVGSN